MWPNHKRRRDINVMFCKDCKAARGLCLGEIGILVCSRKLNGELRKCTQVFLFTLTGILVQAIIHVCLVCGDFLRHGWFNLYSVFCSSDEEQWYHVNWGERSQDYFQYRAVVICTMISMKLIYYSMFKEVSSSSTLILI